MNKTLLALLAGVAIGIVVAPDKGSETIKKLRGRIKDLGDQAEDCVSDLADKGKNLFRQGRERLDETIN